VASNGNLLRFLVGRSSLASYVFVCLEVTADGTDGGALDWGELLFRQQPNDPSTTPQSFDRRFRAASGALGTFTQDMGSGSAWTSCSGTCDTLNSGKGKVNNTVQTYEFMIRFSDIWGTDTPLASQTAGFAIVAFNSTGSVTYTWGSSSVDENNPDSWGLLEIPEFPNMVFAAVGVILIVGWLRRRRA